MDTKLTIRLKPNVIDRAKIFAKDNNISLSKIIEAYLDSLTNPSPMDIEITPLVESLSGVVELPENYDYKEEYSDYLLEKYK
jgi:hypothetical protein